MTYDYSFTPDRSLITVQHDNCKLIALWNDKERWGDLAVISDCGNYAYEWDGTGGRFWMVLKSAYDYLMDKLLSGHGEAVTLKPLESKLRIVNACLPLTGHEKVALMECESEQDFFRWANDVGVEDVDQYFVYGYSEAAERFAQHIIPRINELGEEMRKLAAKTAAFHEEP